MAYSNGQLPDSELSNIYKGRLRKGGAARSWIGMYYYLGHHHGVWLRPTGPVSSYRDLATQQAFYQAYLRGEGALAAYPGTSNHGLGLAVDIPDERMKHLVRLYGHLFDWGIAGGKLHSDAPSEDWHCTYRGDIAKPNRKAAYWYWRYRMARRKKR